MSTVGRSPAGLLPLETVLGCLHGQSTAHAEWAGTPGRWKVWTLVDLACNLRKDLAVSLRSCVAAYLLASRHWSQGAEPYEGLCCTPTAIPVEGLAGSGRCIRKVLGPSWSVDFARLMVPVVEFLLAGCSTLAPVDQCDVEGSVLSIYVATLALVPARGIAQFENVVLRGDEAECNHVRSFVSSRKLDRHSADCCIETLRTISRSLAGCAGCHVDSVGFG